MNPLQFDPVVRVKTQAIVWPGTTQPRQATLNALDAALKTAIEEVVRKFTIPSEHLLRRLPHEPQSEFLVEVTIKRGVVNPIQYFGGPFR